MLVCYHLLGEKGRLVANFIEDAINQQRQETILSISNLVQHTLKIYSGKLMICSVKCDCIQLGGFVKALTAINLLQPVTHPYTGYSIRRLSALLRNLSILHCASIYNAPAFSHIAESIAKDVTRLEEDCTYKFKGKKIRRLKVPRQRSASKFLLSGLMIGYRDRLECLESSPNNSRPLGRL